jgi:hypothetical protein
MELQRLSTMYPALTSNGRHLPAGLRRRVRQLRKQALHVQLSNENTAERKTILCKATKNGCDIQTGRNDKLTRSILDICTGL